MDHIFSNSDDEERNYNEKISLDELYDRRHQIQQQRINIYKKILGRVHTKIKTTARQKNSNPYLFYVIPEIIFGIPKYDIGECSQYIMDKLIDNGFNVKYTHPNLLFISWEHYIPSYKREEIRIKTGKNIDGFGNIIKKKKNKFELNFSNNKEENMDNLLLNNNDKPEKTPRKKNNEYRDISSYKNIGIYNSDIFNKLNDKLNS
jgi:hypothetical protein